MLIKELEYNGFFRNGRSDTDVKPELKSRLNSKYKHFKYRYATSPKAAFEKECHNYHDFGGSEKLDNKIHPSCPAGANWKCPVCDTLTKG